MRKAFTLLFSILILTFMCSCKESASDKIAHLVKKWKNREIIYPTQMYFTILGQDTVSTYSIMNSKYSIITYVDSIGCTSCKLQLRKWSDFIAELDSLIADSVVPVHFFLHPKSRKEILTILKHEQFNYPVCIDEKDSINLLNHFPQDMSFQTFLLDEDSKVVAIGNPILNPKIKDLYFNIISGKSGEEGSRIPMTKIAISDRMVNMGSFLWTEDKEKRVILRNVGPYPLVINEILTSCGCIVVEYDKKPILPKDSAYVTIKYKADHPEHFNKTITLYCNTDDSPLQLKVSGNAQ